VKILGIAGSLRKGSYNRAALRAAQKEAPSEAEIEIFDLEGIPPFNDDLVSTPPEGVRQLKAKIKAADAVLFATPEYNYSVSGVLKNAIDWGSRPPGDNAWDGKPAAILSASSGLLGGVRAQYHLRQTLAALNMFILNRPEVMIAKAREKFDSEGNLSDEDTRKRIQALVQALMDWTLKLTVDSRQ
jgi:chromate reductase